MYFLSDDIDDNTGKIDDSIIQNDEHKLLDKFYGGVNTVKDIDPGYCFGTVGQFNCQQQCDTLMRVFHRTVEFDGVPHWEPATIGQVCLAQGSNVRVNFADLALKVSVVVAKMVVKQMLQCTKDLFAIRPSWHGNEKFPFTSDGHIPDYSDNGAKGADLPNTLWAGRDQHGRIVDTNQVLYGDYQYIEFDSMEDLCMSGCTQTRPTAEALAQKQGKDVTFPTCDENQPCDSYLIVLRLIEEFKIFDNGGGEFDGIADKATKILEEYYNSWDNSLELVFGEAT